MYRTRKSIKPISEYTMRCINSIVWIFREYPFQKLSSRRILAPDRIISIRCIRTGEKVDGTEDLYAYSSGGTMIPLESGGEVAFDGVVTMKATGADYQSLQNEDLKIIVTAYAVNTIASRDGVSESWTDYEAGGNQEMIAGMEN